MRQVLAAHYRERWATFPVYKGLQKSHGAVIAMLKRREAPTQK